MLSDTEKHYLRVARAPELQDRRERLLYRLLEMLPGSLTWSTFILMVLGSKFFPGYTSIFVIAFVSFWFLRTINLTFHLRHSFNKMREHAKVNWRERLETVPLPHPDLPKLKSWQDIHHLVVLVSAGEPFEVVAESLNSLLHSGTNTEKLLVVLGLEERMGEQAQRVAEEVRVRFADKFRRLLITFHPDKLKGELAAKGANERWTGKQALKEIIEPLGLPLENVIVSAFDIDTVVVPGYFECLNYHYLTAEKPLRSSLQPIPLYTNNIWQAGTLSRMLAFSTTFWQLIQQARPEILITYSSQAIGLKPLVEIGFWQENVVSEDSRIFYQCFLHYDGNWQVVPLFFPVKMDANVSNTFWNTLRGIYKQQRRWAYGSENTPYLFFGFLHNQKIPLAKKFSHGFNILEGFHSWTTHSIILLLLGWLPLLLGATEFKFTILSYNLPKIVESFMRIAMLGLIFSAYFTIFLMPPAPESKKSKIHYLPLILQWLLGPVVILLSTVPAIEAVTRLMLGKYMGFWVTPKSRFKEKVKTADIIQGPAQTHTPRS